MPSTKKNKNKSSTAKPETITLDEQYQEVIRFLREYADHMREVARDAWKQALFGGTGALLFTLVFTKLLGKKIGPWGGVLGAILGSFLGYSMTSEYDAQVDRLAAVTKTSDKKKLVDAICQIMKEKGKLESTQVLKQKGAMKEAFFEVTKQSTTRAMIWKACKDALDGLEKSPDSKKKD